MTATIDEVSNTPGESERAELVRKMQRKDAWKRRLPLMPALLFTIVVTQIPFVLVVYYSLTDWNLGTFPIPVREWVGFENFTQAWSQTPFRDAAWNSIFMTVAAVLLSLILGTLIAILLDRKVLGQGLLRTVMISPFLIMPVVASQIWVGPIYSSDFGVLNWLIGEFGGEPTPFSTQWPLWSIILVLVWQWTPFMMLIILAGLQSQPTDVLEAARVDGASTMSIFFQITLPHLRRYMELGILLGTIYLVQVFDHVVVIGGGRPSANNVGYYIYDRAIASGKDFGQASAYGVVVVVASIIIANLGMRVLSSLLEGEEPA